MNRSYDYFLYSKVRNKHNMVQSAPAHIVRYTHARTMPGKNALLRPQTIKKLSCNKYPARTQHPVRMSGWSQIILAGAHSEWSGFLLRVGHDPLLNYPLTERGYPYE